jgi:hypothetical protein
MYKQLQHSDLYYLQVFFLLLRQAFLSICPSGNISLSAYRRQCREALEVWQSGADKKIAEKKRTTDLM